MFFILSKILEFLLLPLTWILGLLILSFCIKKEHLRRKLMALAIGIALFFTNPFIVSRTLNWWETDPYNSAIITQPYDVAIVLGGSLRYFDDHTQRPVYSMSVDRLLQGIALYKQGKVRKILLSGGSGMVFSPEEKESVVLEKVLLQSGIPAADILIENESRNTYENAVNSAKMLNASHPNGRFLLVTSAFHMRRSLACFRKTRLQIDAFPVDEKAGIRPLTPDNTIVPDAQCLVNWDMLFHEWFGMITYKLAGYI